MNPPLQPLDLWAVSLQASGLSPHTVRAYTGNVRRCAALSGCPPEDLTSDLVAAWLAASTAPATRAQYYKCVHLWQAWLTDTGRPAPPMTAGIRRPGQPGGVPDPITERDLARVLASPLTGAERAMVLLGAQQGLRVHEIAKVSGADVDVFGRDLRVTGKGGRTAVLPLDPAVARIARRMPPGHWFPAPADPGAPMSANRCWGVLRSACARAGVDARPHQLRHRYATALVRAGVPLTTVAVLMRHTSMRTTAQYVQVVAADLRAAQALLAA
jgi:integrase/recombinase XerD